MFFSCRSSSKSFSDSLNDDLINFSERQETEHDYHDSDDDDALSLRDLPIYSSGSSDGSCSMNQSEYQEKADTVFEFVSYSGELASKYDDDHHDIVFCGKLITCKNGANQDQTSKPQSSIRDRVSDGGLKSHRSLRALFSWRRLKIGFFRKPASKNKLSQSTQGKSSQMEKRSPPKKVSTLLTSPTKSRWYLFMFGQTRFPQAMTMDLSDLKSRQRRKCSPSSSMNLRAAAGESGRRRGLWSLMKESALTVSKTNANDVVRAVGCVSLV